MPKNVLKIDRFEGGINSNADPKDIDKTEVADATDAYFSVKGQVSTLGLAKPSNDIDFLGNAAVTSGYGLVAFQTEHSLTEAASGSYTSWSSPVLNNPTNGLKPNFSIHLGDFEPHPTTSYSNPSGEFAGWWSNQMGGQAPVSYGFFHDPVAIRDNWGFRIHIGTTLGTPLISYPISTDSTQSTTVTDENGNSKTFTYTILTADDDSGVSRKWVQMCPDLISDFAWYPDTFDTNQYASPSYRYFFKTLNHPGSVLDQIASYENQVGGYSLGWLTPGDNLNNTTPPTGMGYDGKSNMLLTLAGIMSQEENTTVNLNGEEDNYTSLDVFLEAQAVGQDFTPSNYYIWVEYRHYSEEDHVINPDYDRNFGSLHNNGTKDYNFLSIPQLMDSEHVAYDISELQILNNMTSNSAVTNLMSEGYYEPQEVLGESGWFPYTTLWPKLTRRLLAGSDATHLSWVSTLQESDGGDNAVSGETYGLTITGPNITDTVDYSQVYSATGNDQLTEIAATLRDAINPTYGSELVTQNPDFAAGTGWTTGDGWVVHAGVATCSENNNSLHQTCALDVSSWYKVEVDVSLTSGILYIDLGDSDGGNRQQTGMSGNNQIFIMKTPSSHPDGNELIRFYGGSFRGSIDNVSVKKITDTGVGGLIADIPSGSQLRIQTTGLGQALPYEIRPYITKGTSHAYKETATEVLALIDDQSDLYICDTSSGNWSTMFNNNNSHQVITGIADDTTGEPRFTVTGHGYENGNIVSIKGTANYDGIHTVKDKTTNTFDIAATYVAETAASTMTVTLISTTSINNTSTLLWPNSGAKLQSFSNNGILRISDSNFDNASNKSSWIGYISKQDWFNQDGTTNPVDIEGWYVRDQHQGFASNPTDWIDARWDESVGSIENGGKMKIQIQATGSGGSWTEDNYKFFATAVYDDGTETLPTRSNTDGLLFKDGSNYHLAVGSTETITLNVGVDPVINGIYTFDPRMKGIRIYFAKEKEGYGTFYELGLIHFKKGFVRGDGGDTTAWSALGSDNNDAQIATVTFTNEYLASTYEQVTGYSATNDSVPDIRWKCATVVGNTTFIGNLKYDDGLGEKYYPSQMIGSIPTKLDTFVVPLGILEYVTNDGDEIIQLENFSDRLLQFRRNALYIINISTYGEEFMEEEHKWKGVSNPHHVVWTPEGIIWANQYSVYRYDGKDVNDLMETKKGTFKDNRSISRTDWDSFFGDTSTVIYDPITNQIIVKRSTTGSSSINCGDIYLLDLDNGGWSFGKNRFIGASATDTPYQTNAITVANGKVYMLQSFTENGGRFRNWASIGKGGVPSTDTDT
tara:strand:+ start:47 stop:3985 length:3939 start_codon:yes stop_codon:yes gene_type:complete